MSGTPLDPAAGAPPAPVGRAARTASPPSGPGTLAGPAPPDTLAGPATRTSPPAQAPAPKHPVPGVTPPPDGRPCGDTAPDRGRPPTSQAPGGGARRAVSAPPPGQDARDAWKAADSAHKAAKRRGRFTRAPKRTGPGMIRRPPPTTPDGDDVA